MALFVSQAVPRFSSTTTTSTVGISESRAEITVPSGATSVHISTAEDTAANLPIYIGPDDTDNTGIQIGSKSGTQPYSNVYVELAPNAALWGNNDSTRATTNVNFVWFYD